MTSMKTTAKIKICGLTAPKEAQYLNENQIDFAGMVLFFPKSKRCITIERAKEIIARLSDTVKSVAVVVSPSLEQVRQIGDAGFSYIQIHGEIPDGIGKVSQMPILKAFNVSDLEQYEKYHNNPQIAGYVLDAHEAGSGKTFDWSLVEKLPRDGKLFLLAGGLNPQNVGEALRIVQPDGVDVSSGVENESGCGKDPEKIRAFAQEVRNELGNYLEMK